MSFEQFDALLSDVRAEIGDMATADPDDGAIAAVQRQLDALYTWTRGGRCPAQEEKDQLNFGAIASRELSCYPVAESLYALASHVIWWRSSRA